jgi:hypothetical protein
MLSRQGSEMSHTIDELAQRSCSQRRTSYDTSPARSDHTGGGPLCATVFGAGLAPCAGLAPGGDAHARGPHGDRGLAGDGAAWPARHGSQMLLGGLLTRRVPPSATLVLGADDTLERRSGRKITAKGCYRDAVRSSETHVICCCGLEWGSMMLVVPVPWSRRV